MAQWRISDSLYEIFGMHIPQTAIAKFLCNKICNVQNFKIKKSFNIFWKSAMSAVSIICLNNKITKCRFFRAPYFLARTSKYKLEEYLYEVWSNYVLVMQ